MDCDGCTLLFERGNMIEAEFENEDCFVMDTDQLWYDCQRHNVNEMMDRSDLLFYWWTINTVDCRKGKVTVELFVSLVRICEQYNRRIETP